MRDSTESFAARAARVTEASLRHRGGMKWGAAATDVIPAWVAESDFEVSEPVRAALLDVVERGEFGYVSDARRDRFRHAVAGWYAEEYGVAIPADHVQPVGDVIEAYRHAIRDFTAPGSPIVVPVPSYPPFAAVAAEEGRVVVTVGIGPDGIDLDALETAMRERPSLLVLCNPHNPLGHVAGLGELLAISKIVERHGGRVFADEIHAPLVLDDLMHVPYAAVSDASAAHTLTAFAASKAFNLPALKAAALIVSNPQDLDRWHALGPLAGHGASVAGLAAGTAALEDGRAWLGDLVSYLRGNRDRVAEVIDQIDGAQFVRSRATYLQWIDLAGARTGGTAGTAAEQCAAFGLLVNDGTAFGGFADCIRLNFASPRHLLDEALSRLTRTFEQTRSANVA